MKRFLLTAIFAVFSILFAFPDSSFAIENPLSMPGNKVGVHILFPQEINLAADLINSNGGDWGYVTIPLQAGDRDLVKWQKFMNDAKRLHVVPIIRLATEGNYFNTTVWRKPSQEDVLDFANFLNSLVWPVKNRYIVVFNEVNRSDEWEGNLDPGEYAELLSYAISAFKTLNEDFFIISSGMDNAASNIRGEYMNEYDYMVEMDEAVPGIFGLIDGLGSHSYPNPGFKQMPYILTSQSIDSFNFEKNLATRLSDKDLPIFITETGWSKDALSESQICDYFKYAFKYVWDDKNIVTVTTFLLQAGTKPFSQFSLVDVDGKNNKIFSAIAEISKVKGKPTINEDFNPPAYIKPENLPVKIFPQKYQYENIPSYKTDTATEFFKWLLKLSF
jgi:hypothetical protein